MMKLYNFSPETIAHPNGCFPGLRGRSSAFYNLLQFNDLVVNEDGDCTGAVYADDNDGM